MWQYGQNQPTNRAQLLTTFESEMYKTRDMNMRNNFFGNSQLNQFEKFGS